MSKERVVDSGVGAWWMVRGRELDREEIRLKCDADGSFERL